MQAEVRGDGNEAPAGEPRAQSMGPRGVAAAAHRPAVVQVHQHGRAPGQRSRLPADLRALDAMGARPPGLDGLRPGTPSVQIL